MQKTTFLRSRQPAAVWNPSLAKVLNLISDIGGVSSMTNKVLSVRFWYGQYQGIHQSCFQLVKWRLLSLSPHPLRMWSSQVSKGCSNVSIASYKFAVIIGEAEELLNLFLGLRLRPLVNSCLFSEDQYWYPMQYNVPKVIYRAQAKGTLWSLSTELVLLQLLQNPMQRCSSCLDGILLKIRILSR